MNERRSPKLPIESLSEVAWQRIESNVFAELEEQSALAHPAPSVPASRTRMLGIAVAAALVLAVTSSAWLSFDRDAMRTTRIVTDSGSAETVLGDVLLRLGPKTAFTAVGEDTGHLVFLERGTIDFSVPPRGGRRPFVVQSGDVRVEVVGTQFTVARHGASVTVEVREGTVRVHARGETKLVHAGERFDASESSVNAAQDEDQASRTPTLEEPSSSAGARTPRERIGRRASRGGAGPRIASGSIEEAVPSPAPNAPEGARARFETASRLESQDPERALALYHALAEERGPWAANALFAAGRLELDRGRAAPAKRLLERYLDRHPGGPNAEDARALLRRLH